MSNTAALRPPLPPPQLRWFRPPVQTRSERTLQKLLDAAERLLEVGSFEDLTVQGVVAEAGASVGSFYGRFESKDALLHALHERYVAESLPTTEAAFAAEAWEGQSLEHIVRNLVRFLVEFTMEHRGLKRALVVACADDPVYRARSSELAWFVVERLAAKLAERSGEHGHPDPARAAETLHRIVFSFLDQLVVYGDDDPIGAPRSTEEHAAELSEVALAYLRVPEATR